MQMDTPSTHEDDGNKSRKSIIFKKHNFHSNYKKLRLDEELEITIIIKQNCLQINFFAQKDH